MESILNSKLIYSNVVGGKDGSDNLCSNYLTTIMAYTDGAQRMAFVFIR